MVNDPLSILCCPVCKNSLCTGNINPGEKETGRCCYCVQCNRNYFSGGGIIRFINDDEVRKFSRRFNFFRAVYARIYTPLTRLLFIPCGGENKARHEVLDKLELSPGGTILETGIGTGDNLPFLQPFFGSGIYVGLDNQQRMLNACRKKLKRLEMDAELHLANAEQLPYKDEVFDVVFHLGAFNLFSNKKQALEEMIRVAKPGTRIVIADETEKACQLFSILLGKQEPVILPDYLVPDSMLEKKLEIIWNGYGYLLSFRKP